ncbi:hypothetical protein HYX16_02920 [Candidatus Woesearchaeota archaeon]|nr:hypothetical protein [Candidatus Woesearchaeota archaeon]
MQYQHCGRCRKEEDIPTYQYLVLGDRRADMCTECFGTLRVLLYYGGILRFKSQDRKDVGMKIRLAQEGEGLKDIYLTNEGSNILKKWFKVGSLEEKASE